MAEPIRPPLARELAIGLATFALYLAVDTLGDRRGAARQAAGRAHAMDVFRLESWLHLDLEPRANAWLDLHPLLRTLANYEYGSTYIIAAFALLTWLYLRRPDEYRAARSSFVLLNVVAIGCFALYPVTPPRLMPGLGFIDTVTQGHTVGSWGSPLVSHANQLAAMPSLHVGWALWVSVVLARLSGGRGTQLFSAAHVALTTWVVVATANHYLLDAVAAAVLVPVCVLAPRALATAVPAFRVPAVLRELAPGGRRLIGERMRILRKAAPLPPTSSRVPAADAFFLHIESPRYPQQVGGVVPLDVTNRPAGSPSQTEVIDLIRERLGDLPRLRQRLDLPASRWRRARWQDHDELDWDWHVPVHDLSAPDGSPGGPGALDRLVAELAGTPLPRDRPLWRMVIAHNVEPDQAAVIFIVHHVIADGIGTVAQALHLLEPPWPQPVGAGPRINLVQRSAAIVTGLGQLAFDGGAKPLNGTAESPATGDGNSPTTLARTFVRLALPLPAVRTAARSANARVSDLLLCAVAGGLARLELPLLPSRLRVAVPLMVREPDAAAEGNVTAAVMIDLPVAAMPERERLREIAGRSSRLRSGSRALASRFVMADVAGLMPAPMHSWFARTVYGPRYFHAIVSNMPGPPVQFSLAKATVVEAYPLLPLAPETALAVGTLGWNGTLCISLTTGDWLEPHTEQLLQGIRDSLHELGIPQPAPEIPQDFTQWARQPSAHPSTPEPLNPLP